MTPVIPMRSFRKLLKTVDCKLCRLSNLVKRCFNGLRNARRVTTRYDTAADSFLRFIDIISIRVLLRHSSTWPKYRRAAGALGLAELG